MSQEEIDLAGHGQRCAEVTERASETQDHGLSVDFGCCSSGSPLR